MTERVGLGIDNCVILLRYSEISHTGTGRKKDVLTFEIHEFVFLQKISVIAEG